MDPIFGEFSLANEATVLFWCVLCVRWKFSDLLFVFSCTTPANIITLQELALQPKLLKLEQQQQDKTAEDKRRLQEQQQQGREPGQPLEVRERPVISPVNRDAGAGADAGATAEVGSEPGEGADASAPAIRSDVSSTGSQVGSPTQAQPQSSLGANELKMLLRSWCDAVEKPGRPVEELGPEKRVEFDLRPREGAANPPLPLTSKAPGLVDKITALLKISSPRYQEHDCGALTVYSGQSLLLFAEWRVVITTPQRVHIVRYMLRLLALLYENGYETEWASFVRKNNDSPWAAKDQQIAREFSVLKTIFPTGRSYIFGAVDQDHYFYYIYDDIKRDASGANANPESIKEDNVQFNLNMYGVSLAGNEESLKRFNLTGITLEAPRPASPLQRGTTKSSPGSRTSPNAPSAFPAVPSQQQPQQPQQQQQQQQQQQSSSMATPDESFEAANNNEQTGSTVGSHDSAPFDEYAESTPATPTCLPMPSSTGAAGAAGASAGNTPPSTAGALAAFPAATTGAGAGAGAAATSSSASASASASALASAAKKGRRARGKDELAVEVIKQACRFVLPDQYETLRLLRDVKSSDASCDGAPRYAATYESTIDVLDETRSGIVRMVDEFQPERFTIIALCDPHSPAATALREHKPIGVEPALFPDYSLINRTMNKFAWGYRVLSFTYNRTIFPTTPVVAAAATSSVAVQRE